MSDKPEDTKSVPPLTRIPKREAPQRRLDSIARLINGAEVCSAVCFFNDHFIIANNSTSNVPTTLQSKYFAFFKHIVQTNLEQRTPEWGADLEKREDKLLAESLAEAKNPHTRVARLRNAIKELQDGHAISDAAKTELLMAKATTEGSRGEDPVFDSAMSKISITRDNKLEGHQNLREETDFLFRYYDAKIQEQLADLKIRLPVDIAKVKESLLAPPGHEKAFSPQILAALAKPRNFYPIGKIGTNNAHAEMKIIDEIAQQHRLDTPLREPIYIGVSKLCCLNCMATIRVLNKKISIITFDDETQVPEAAAAAGTTTTAGQDSTPRGQIASIQKPHESPIKTRGTHLADTINWGVPNFLATNQDLLQEYHKELASCLEEVKQNKLKPVKQTAKPSPSPEGKRQDDSDHKDAETPLAAPPPPLDWMAARMSATPHNGTRLSYDDGEPTTVVRQHQDSNFGGETPELEAPGTVAKKLSAAASPQQQSNDRWGGLTTSPKRPWTSASSAKKASEATSPQQRSSGRWTAASSSSPTTPNTTTTRTRYHQERLQEQQEDKKERKM